MPILRRLLAALDAWVVIDVRWRAGALERLLDEDHAALVGLLTGLLHRLGWEVHVEVTYSEFGERGSIDVLAFWRPVGLLLVIEVKTDLASVEGMLRKLDEKVRLAPKVGRERFGWDARQVARLIVLPDASTLRRRASRQAAVLEKALPARAVEVRQWLRRPSGALAGLWFVSGSHRRTRMQRCGGPERVRVGKRAARRHSAAA